ncbi:MAG: mannose-6-phosphate isomerase, class I [Spirochaetales bacterium]|nr:mannose-6-phosphate isomerase, class I [Spirochaetales bacterium]
MLRILYRLENPVQHYPWGSTDAIPAILGIENKENKPFAELWMGSHAKAPSKAFTDDGPVPLDRLIAADPSFFLGKAVAERFDGTLPFLLKILSAEKPLSLQAHPNSEQATRGFAQEERRGIPRNAPNRNYRDPNHKPEMLRALTPFSALCGFRNPEEIYANLQPLKNAKRLLQSLSDDPSCRRMFREMLYLEENQKTDLVREAVESSQGKTDPAHYWVCRLVEEYSDDIGILSPLLLNLVELEPGEALELKAGVLHSYLQGTGIEIMANSDNVLRGGLTSKHMDRDELMKVLVFPSDEPRRLAPSKTGKGYTYPTDAREFALWVCETDVPVSLMLPQSPGSSIFLCIRGIFHLQTAGETLEVSSGQTVFAAASAESLHLTGSGLLFRAFVPPEN